MCNGPGPAISPVSSGVLVVGKPVPEPTWVCAVAYWDDSL